jgi:hypothetical protein
MPDHMPHASDGPLPPDLHDMAEALRADSAAWQRQVPPPDRLRALYASLAQEYASTAAPVGEPVAHQSPYHEGSSPMKKRTAWWGGMGAVALVVALIIAFLSVFHAHAPSSTPAPAATPQTLHVTPADGWVKPAALSFGKDITFATSDPLTGYVCGNAVPAFGAETSAPLRFTVTHDGGRTWHEEATTPAEGYTCEVHINPSDAREIVMIARQATTDTTWRSFDGGATWRQMTLPPGDDAQAIIDQPVWAGGTLFVDATLRFGGPMPTLPHILAASSQGGPLVWVDSDPLFQHSPNGGLAPTYAFAIGSTYYAQLWNFVCASAACGTYNSHTFVLQTSDGGAHWSSYTFGDEANLTVFATLADGKTLIGVMDDGATVLFSISHDKGQTWQTLPSVTAKGQFWWVGTDTKSSAPDGTLYSQESTIEYDAQGNIVHTKGPYTLLMLPPGATSWQTIPGLPGAQPFAVSVDGAGHPVAVWSGLSDGMHQVPGLAYHAPQA